MDPTLQALNLFITYVDKEGPFLKVWGQAEKNNSSYVEQFLLGASQQFEQGIGKVPFETLQVGMLVCAKYKDNKYYRARIASIDYLNQCFVEINFLDYGNKDIVPSENIRSLQNFPTSFISIPPLATGFIFAEAHCPGGGEWKDQIFEIISKDLRYREVQCHLLTQATQYYLIRLYIDNTDIGALFISRGLMQPIPLHAQQAVLLSMSMQRKPPAAPVVQAVPPAEINTYKACTLEPMQQYAVYVSFVNEGPTHFSVQLQQSEHMLAKLMKEINEINLRMMEDVPLPGTICLARCQEDGNVCRAVVTNEVDNQFKVFYVDFGNFETLPLECLYQIPFKYVLPKVMAIRLALDGVEKSTVTIEMLLAFKKFVDNRLLYMKVLTSAKKTVIPKCELWDPQTKTSALDVINRAAQHAYPEPLLLSKGFTQPVKVSYVFSCNRFFVQLSSKEQELSKLMEDLQVSCQSNEAIYDIKIGLPCCALFETDQLWYRSEIVEVVDTEKVKVKYIDYGNEEVVPVIHLRMVEGELLTVLRPQAIECCLNGYQNMGADETRDALLEELILEQSFTMKVSEMLDKKALVELIDANNYNVASLLLDKIAASKSQVSPMLVQAGNTLEHRKTSDSSDNYRPQRKPAKDWSRNEKPENRNPDRPNEKSWRYENKDGRQNDVNSNDGSPDSGAWRQNNKGFNRNEKNDRDRDRGDRDRGDRDRGDRDQRGERQSINDRFNRNRNERGNDTKNNNWNNKENGFENSPSWSSPVNEATPPAKDSWENASPSPVQKSYENRKPWDDKFGGKKKFDDKGDREERGDRGWQNKDGFKRDGFKKDYRKDGGEMSSSESEQSFRKGPRTSSRNDRGGGGNRFQNRSENSFGNASAHASWSVSDVSTPIDAAPSTTTFDQLDVIGSEAAVVISWFHNPSHFYCQLQSGKPKFETLMEEIQEFYKKRKPERCVTGAPVVGLFPEDNVLYRAKVLEALGTQYKVFYVDFGNVSTISKVWPIEKKFMLMPAQAVCCGLSGIAANGDSWQDPSTFSEFFDKEVFTARFLEKNEERTYLELWDNQKEVSQLLIQAKLAVPVAAQSEGGIEIPLLLNQQFRVVLKSVNNLTDIIVALECGLALTCKAHNLEMASESYEDVLKGYLEQTLIVYVDNILENDLLDVTFYDNEGNKLVILAPDEGALDNVEPLCPLLMISSRIYGYVCFANETAVFIQPSVHAEQLSSLLEQMFEAYESVTQETSIIPEEGFVYAVHSADGNWYRGRVDSFDDDKATVTYIDYGNSESVGFSELRELKSEFNVPNIMCLQVTLPSGIGLPFLEKEVLTTIYYGETGWEGTVEECAQSMQVEEVAEVVGGATISADSGADLQEGTLVQETVQPQEKVSDLDQSHVGEVVEAELGAAVVKTPLIGTPVFVSHIDAPTEFYVQFAESSTALDELQQKLQDTAEEMPALETVSVGGFCAAPYSVDHQWYRAEVLDADEDITTVRFVDYGNTDVINNKTTQVKTLPSNLLTLAVYATRCSLKLKAIEEEWSQQALELFEKLANQGNVTAEFIIQDEKTNIVELYSDGENIKDALLAQNLAVPCEIVIESKTTCFVSHLNSPSEFWVQMENCVDELEWIAEQLSVAEQFPELEDTAPGTLCAALFPDDEMWYRARILSNTVAGVELLFIDYGNSSFSSSLRQLPEDLVITAPLAQKCCLQRSEGIPYWTKEAQAKFAEISAEGQTIFEMKKISTGETATVELLLSGENIVPKILPVTEDGFVKNFKTLDSLKVEKNGELLPESVCLEPMPGMEWDEESNKKFLELYPDGTVFQVEVLGEDCVRLYKEGVDIRPHLGGVKGSLNLSTTQEEKTENLGISEDRVIDYLPGGDILDNKHSNEDSSRNDTDVNQEGTEATDTITTDSEPVYDKEELGPGHVDLFTDKTKDKNSTQESETDSGHHSEHEILKEDEKFGAEVEENGDKEDGKNVVEKIEVQETVETKVGTSVEVPLTVIEKELEPASSVSLEHEIQKENEEAPEEVDQEAEKKDKENGKSDVEKIEVQEIAEPKISSHVENPVAASIDNAEKEFEPVDKTGISEESENDSEHHEEKEGTKDHESVEPKIGTHEEELVAAAIDNAEKEFELVGMTDISEESESNSEDNLKHHISKEDEKAAEIVDKKSEEKDQKSVESKVSTHVEDPVAVSIDNAEKEFELVGMADISEESESDSIDQLKHHITKEVEKAAEIVDKKAEENDQKSVESKVSTHEEETVATSMDHPEMGLKPVAKTDIISKEVIATVDAKDELGFKPQQNKTSSRSSSVDRLVVSHDDKILPGSVSRSHSPTAEEPVSRPSSSQEHLPHLFSKSNSRSSSVDRTKSHDDKILPGSVSRPRTPSPSEQEQIEEGGVSRPSSSQGRYSSHDEKILPAVLSRPHSPLPDDPESNNY